MQSDASLKSGSFSRKKSLKLKFQMVACFETLVSSDETLVSLDETLVSCRETKKGTVMQMQIELGLRLLNLLRNLYQLPVLSEIYIAFAVAKRLFPKRLFRKWQ